METQCGRVKGLGKAVRRSQEQCEEPLLSAQDVELALPGPCFESAKRANRVSGCSPEAEPLLSIK